MKQSHNQVSNIIITLLVALIPISGAYEFLASIGINPSFSITFFKVPREILMFLLFIVSLMNILKPNFSNILTLYVLILLGITSVCFLSNDASEVAVFGVRWALPFFLMPLLNNQISNEFLIKIAKLLFVVLLLNVICQMFQMFLMPAYRGVNLFGLSGRLGGFFALPSIAGAFSAIVLFFISYFPPFKTKWKMVFYKGLAIFGVFLSMSSTGMGLILIVIGLPIAMRSKFSFLIIVASFFLSAIALSSLDSLTGRAEGSSEASFSTRIDIFLAQVNNSEIVSIGNFGNATNGAVGSGRRSEAMTQAFVVDSLYTTVLVNYGLLPFLIFMVLLLLSAVYIFFIYQDIRLKIFFIVVVLSSASLITTEIYPVNLLIVILGAYFLNGCINHHNIKIISTNILPIDNN